MYEFSEESLTIQVELGEDDPAESENADGWLTLPDGTKWSATFLTYAELGRIMDRWKVTGEGLHGEYFTCPDLVLIRTPGVEGMCAAIKDMVANGDHELSLRKIE